jgi:hypothetical protein
MIRRIARRAGAPDLSEILERLPGSELQTLLMHVFRERSVGRQPAALMAQRRADATVAPSPVDARRLHEVERLALAVAVDFSAVALSPVAPFGLHRSLGGNDQHTVCSTIRGTEVLGDPTAALAVEAALQRQRGESVVRLCWHGRVLRMQPFPEGITQHFGLFSLVTAARSEPGNAFELRALRDHIAVYLELLAALTRSGFDLGSPRVEVSDAAVLRDLLDGAGAELSQLTAEARISDEEPEALLAARGIQLPAFVEQVPAGLPRSRRLEHVRSEVFDELAARFPEATLGFRAGRLQSAGYYDGLMLNIAIPVAGGAALSVADGGTTDWTARMLSSRKERLFTSGIGTELLARLA